MAAPVMLMILDGWGWREAREANAVRLAQTPNFDRLYENNPHAFLTTCGPAVGLPEGQMGNSEVGHLNIGAGRVVMQELPRIDQAIESGDFAERLAATGLADTLKATGGRCHILGLVSDGGVHSHQRHAVAAAKALREAGAHALVHAFTDGRDTAPDSAPRFLAELQEALPGDVPIATVSGRYYAMDRDNRWERVQKAYDAIVHAKGEGADSAAAALEAAQAAGVTDEFVLPTVIGGYAGMAEGDALLCFNFRSDRAREILTALLDPAFDGFDRGDPPALSAAVGMVAYSTQLSERMAILFEPQNLEDGLAETVSRAGKSQIHLAETEKYPHVTYFLNGGREEPFAGEDRTMVPSPKVATYDLQPEMSAPELTEAVMAAIESERYDLIVVNFANPDMVGHTGSLPAAIKAVETVDGSLGTIADALAQKGGALIFTADHGNCETMVDPQTGSPHTAHTLNDVPVVLVAPRRARLRNGVLADLAPTVLALMDIPQPEAMTGRSLAEFAD